MTPGGPGRTRGRGRGSRPRGVCAPISPTPPGSRGPCWSTTPRGSKRCARAPTSPGPHRLGLALAARPGHRPHGRLAQRRHRWLHVVPRCRPAGGRRRGGAVRGGGARRHDLGGLRPAPAAGRCPVIAAWKGAGSGSAGGRGAEAAAAHPRGADRRLRRAGCARRGGHRLISLIELLDGPHRPVVHRLVLAQPVLRRRVSPNPVAASRTARPRSRTSPQLGGLRARCCAAMRPSTLTGVAGIERGEQEHPQHLLVAHRRPRARAA